MPTCAAVNQAVQSGGVQWLVPKQYGEASTTDDIYITLQTYTSLNDSYIVNGRVIAYTMSRSGDIWLKKSAFNINSIADLLSKINIIIPGHTSTSTGISAITDKGDYFTITVEVTNSSNSLTAYNTFKIMYTP